MRIPALNLDRMSERRMALLVLGAALLVYLPLAGSYGLWDPWETHYGEVARQMTARGDFISLWWPGSPRETAVFQTKPVLTFWLMSLGMHIARIGLPGGAAGEMALGTRAEWAVRTPFCLLAALGIYGVYLVTSRLAGRRAGVLAAAVLGTCPMYALVGRQAMTDMTYVAPMILAIALATLAVLGARAAAPDEPAPAPLPRRGPWRFLRWPHHPLFYGGMALFAIATVPQLVIYSLDLRVQVPWGGRTLMMYGVVAMIPYWVGFLAVLFLAARSTQVSSLYLYLAATLCGLAVLGKGLAGLGLPVLIFAAYLAATGAWRRLRQRELWYAALVCVLICAVVAVPWHHAMFIRHGSAWWNEMFGDNHWRRLMLGRHGDRGTFEYFLRELGYGTLPWAALAVPALAAAGLRRSGDERRQAAVWLGAIWFAGAYSLVSLSMTKFHHYVLPAIPGLAIAIGCYLDDLWAGRGGRREATAVALLGAPVLLLVTVDLVSAKDAAERFLWLFSYDYVYNRSGRAWPEVLDFRPALILFAVLFACGLGAMAVRRFRRGALVGLVGAAVLFTFFLLDHYMPSVAPYWSQKPILAAYYRERRSPDERLVAYKMFWRGETFYTKNVIYEGPNEERTVFDSDGKEADEALKAWIDRHRGQRHYFLIEPSRRGHLESMLPPEARASFSVVEQPNNKFMLARVQL
jgi:4-amino-4-deoxy-L-arabinose transferase-like glycosyltransferase